jgi:flagellar biosynthetic protein FlhB
MSEHSDAEKTEKATPEKRKKAREQGDFAKSRDAGGVMAALATLLTLSAMGPAAVSVLMNFTAYCFGEHVDLLDTGAGSLLQRAGGVLAGLILPGAFAAAVGAAAIGFVQAGFHPQAELVSFNFGRLDPISKLKQMFKPTQALSELVQGLLRVGVVAYAVYGTVRDTLPRIVAISRGALTDAAHELVSAIGTLALHASLALALLAGLEYGWNKFQLEKRLMMSRQEIKDEMKQAEGDPRIKARQRARARERLKRGLAKQVKSSDVVLANPTHISVALRYRAKDGAPVVTAKGYDEIAMHMRKIAKDAGIPVVENRMLARAIAARVKVGRAIPADLYAAVAEVLAFVYRLRRRVVFG